MLRLCPGDYLFTWVAGQYDSEVGFTIYFNDEAIFNVDYEGINESFPIMFLDYTITCGEDVNEIEAESNFSVMPNPATNYFNIEGENIAKVEVYNATGQMIDVVNVENGNVQISTENYNNGIYFVKATTTNGQVSVQKVVVSK